MKRALFLDRDGVVNLDKHYVHKIEEFEFIDGVFQVCRYFKKLGYLIIVVTNQAGIARGYYSEDDFFKLNSWMIEQFFLENIVIDKVYYCPHHPDFSGPCFCRKPNPGMLLSAKRRFNIDMFNSVLIGDKPSDILAGLDSGITNNYLLKSGYCIDDMEIGSCNIVNNIAEVLSFEN